MGYYEAFRRSKDPPSFMMLFEDTADLVGILLAQTDLTWKEAVRLRFGAPAATSDVAVTQDPTRGPRR